VALDQQNSYHHCHTARLLALLLQDVVKELSSVTTSSLLPPGRLLHTSSLGTLFLQKNGIKFNS
jgi:hypothetical protein